MTGNITEYCYQPCTLQNGVTGTYLIKYESSHIKNYMYGHHFANRNVHSLCCVSCIHTFGIQQFKRHSQATQINYHMLKPISFMHSRCASMYVLQFSSPCSTMLQVIQTVVKTYYLANCAGIATKHPTANYQQCSNSVPVK